MIINTIIIVRVKYSIFGCNLSLDGIFFPLFKGAGFNKSPISCHSLSCVEYVLPLGEG